MTDIIPNKWYGFVPNLLTLLNLVCGVVAIYFAFGNEIQIALILMLAGGLFDFFDGFVARLLKVSGELGKQLDSLADLITFGLLPGVMVFSVQRELILESLGGFHQLSPVQWILLLSPILIPVFSAIRLAKFNIDTRQSNSFIGVPTPASALFFASFTWTLTESNMVEWMRHPLIISVLVLLFSLLMVSEIPLFALKFKNFKWKENNLRFIFLILSLFILLLLHVTGLAIVIFLYITLSLFNNLKKT